MDLRDQRELNKGFGDGLTRAFELTLTPIIVAVAGLLLDNWLGTTPLLVIVFAFWGIAVTTYMAWYRYDHDMRILEDERSARAGSTAPATGRVRARSIANRPPDVGIVDG